MVKKQRGADAVVRTLEAAGVRHIFTLSGNHIMAVFDAAIGSGLSLVHVRHEAAAVHMADAAARLTGTVGVALVTGGPGHANAVGALYTALAAESPVLLLSGHAPLSEIGKGAFQEMDQAAVARPLTKASWCVEAAEDLVASLSRGIEIATSGRPGPVHLSLPSDLLEGPAAAADGVVSRAAAIDDCAADARTIAERLAAAAAPLILAGPRFDSAERRALLERAGRAHDAATAVMASPRGVNDPSLGAFADALADVDLVVLLGKQVDFTLKFGGAPMRADCRVVVVDTEAEARDRARRVFGERLIFESAALPDAVAIALASDDAGAITARGRRARLQEMLDWRPPDWRFATAAQPNRLHPAELCTAVATVLSHHLDAIVVADGGEIGQWAQAIIRTDRRIINGVAGSIGASLPFAVAARLVAPEAPVVAIMGDGTFGFHMAEIDTAVRAGAPFVAVVGNDARWNAEHQIQLRSYGADRLIGCELRATAYDAVATALGGTGATVTSRAELEAALSAALSRSVPTCLNVPIESVPAPVIRNSPKV